MYSKCTGVLETVVLICQYKVIMIRQCNWTKSHALWKYLGSESSLFQCMNRGVAGDMKNDGVKWGSEYVWWLMAFLPAKNEEGFKCCRSRTPFDNGKSHMRAVPSRHTLCEYKKEVKNVVEWVDYKVSAYNCAEEKMGGLLVDSNEGNLTSKRTMVLPSAPWLLWKEFHRIK